MTGVDLTLGQIAIGDECSTNIKLTESLVDDFIVISGDHSRLHTDPHYAKLAGFKGRVVHGVMISSFFSALIGTKLPGNSALLLELSTKFHQPAFVGDKIQVTVSVAEIHESTNCINLKLRACNDQGKKVASGRALVKVRNSS